ncbi:MAG TPA: PAS-domain containing protein, partial [Candidatus Methanomethylicus sp.]|nr:PAS-domain containing protein [Candidatus Methanomethylicus sp.]
MQQLLNLIEFTISISTKLQRAQSAREVQTLLKEEFARSNYVMVIFGLSDDGSKIVVRELDARFEKLRSIPGIKLEGLEFGAEHVKEYMAHIMSGETVQFSFRNAVEMVLPPRLSEAVCNEVVESMGLEVGTLSPIRVRGRVAGIFYMATPRLSEFLTIPIKSLAEHISNALERVALESERKRAEDALRFKNILLTTQQETALDGILIVDENAKIINYNQKFVEMWQIPPKLMATGSDEVIFKSVLDKIADPQSFAKRVKYLYEHRQEHSRDEIVFKDGRILDRYSAPMIGQGRHYGRIWYFRDITEMKRYEESL